jgi:hypothetical protein
MRRLIGALLGLWILLAQPAAVLATAYSPMTYAYEWPIPGGGVASKCVQSGIVDVAQNYAQTVSRNYIPYSCSGASHTVPSGYLGTLVYGYRDGSFCGSSGIYYSNVATSAWQLWATECSNPAGSQTFKTLGFGYTWDGSGYSSFSVWSPAQNY